MTNEINILIADEMHPALMEGLKQVNLRYTYAPDVDEDRLHILLENHNILVIRSKFQLNGAFFKKHPSLQFVARAGAGMDNIDETEAALNNVICVNAGEGNRDAVGEHTIGLLLNLASKITKGHNEVANGIWDREGNRGFEIGSKTVGIIGYGNTGSAVAERLFGFGCKILAYDKYKSDFGNNAVQEVSLNTILNQADVISFHVPLNTETQAWIDDDFINSVKNPFVLLNLSRGKIMSTQAVLSGLKSGKIVAFGTDVLENEDLMSFDEIESDQFKSLLSKPNVVITPHVGGWTAESYKKISLTLLKKIKNHAGLTEEKKKHLGPERQYVG